ELAAAAEAKRQTELAQVAAAKQKAAQAQQALELAQAAAAKLRAEQEAQKQKELELAKLNFLQEKVIAQKQTGGAVSLQNLFGRR
ncbi:MAG: hypothetical protein AB7P17_03890, partial [Nitrospirales bacterium]